MITGVKGPVRSTSQDIVRTYGKWPGSGAPANGLYTPVEDANGRVKWQGWTLTRTGVGLYTLAWAGPPGTNGAVPNLAMSRGDVISAATRYDPIWFKTETLNPCTASIAITVGGVLTDPIANETIRVEVDLCDTGRP